MIPSLDDDSEDLSYSPSTPDEANNPDKHNKLYRELESLSYDAATDSFTLYFQSPNWGENTVSGNHFSPPHNVVTNVKL